MDRIGINLLNHGDNCAVIVPGSTQKFSYQNLMKQVLKATLFIESEIPKYSTVGICADKSSELLALTFGILDANCSFCYLKKDDLNKFDEFKIEYCFSTSQLFLDSFKLKNTLLLCDKKVYFYKYKCQKGISQPNYADKICYKISTSGTTGKRKFINVTFDSIYPNIKSLQEMFNLTSNDVILSAAPITFDVFIVDLFLALYSGASILFLNENHRFDTLVFEKSVTFLQMTPTLFRQYGLENIKSKILHKESSLKYLVLGGEEFPPSKEVHEWQNWDDPLHKRIFNIYGITEMSCWSMIHEVTKEDLEFGKIPLGSTLDIDTIPAYRPYNNTKDFEELLLTTSSRINFFEDNNHWDNEPEQNGLFAYMTNDLVKKINGKIYWYGRTNDLVKRYGERIDLKKIEDLSGEIVQPVSCIMIKKRIALFYQSEHSDISQLLSNHLRLKLNKSEFPDDIKRIDFLPMSSHGKVCKLKLKELYKDILKESSKLQSAEEIFLETINQMFNLQLEKPMTQDTDEHDGKRMRYDIDSTFEQIGGSSFDALRIVMKIEDKMCVMSNALLPKLLDNQHTIKDVFAYIKNLNLEVKNGSNADIKDFVDQKMHQKINLKILKQFNLEKCVDSTPAFLNGHKYVVVGSHSGNLTTIDTKSLSLVSKVNLNDRIECEASQLNDSVVVGCYDGFLYCIDVLNSRVRFKYDSGAMIKSKPLVINDEFIIFGNYNKNKNLTCLRVNEDSAELKWNKLVGNSGILANILQIDNKTCIVCTLNGVVERFSIENGHAMWTKNFEYPIFSSPQKLEAANAILVAEVMRKVYCVDYNGNILWMFETAGHIFSSFVIDEIEQKSYRIYFGCHDNMLRCVNFNYGESNASLEWELKLQSQIYGTPKKVQINRKDFIVSCSTNGYVNLINSLSGKIENSIKLNGDVFSSPLVLNDIIFIGCRDNFVYCISLGK